MPIHYIRPFDHDNYRADHGPLKIMVTQIVIINLKVMPARLSLFNLTLHQIQIDQTYRTEPNQIDRKELKNGLIMSQLPAQMVR